MIRQLNDQQQRTLAISLFVLALLIIASVIIIPAWTVNAASRDRIDQMQLRLDKLQQIAASDKDLRPQYEKIRAARRSAGNYLKSSTEAVAAAELQGILKSLAGASRLQVLSTQILPTSQEDQFIRVGLRGRLRGTLPGIVDTLYAIETNGVFLFLDSVSLRNTFDRARGLRTSGLEFEIDIDLITYMPAEP